MSSKAPSLINSEIKSQQVEPDCKDYAGRIPRKNGQKKVDCRVKKKEGEGNQRNLRKRRRNLEDKAKIESKRKNGNQKQESAEVLFEDWTEKREE